MHTRQILLQNRLIQLQNRRIQLQNKRIQLQTGRIQLQYRRIQLQTGRIQLQTGRIQLQRRLIRLQKPVLCKPLLVLVANKIEILTSCLFNSAAAVVPLEGWCQRRVSGFSGMEWWNGLEWNGLEQNGTFGNFNWWSLLYKDHLLTKTTFIKTFLL